MTMMMRSLVTCVSMTTWLAAVKLDRLVLSEFWTHAFQCSCSHWSLQFANYSWEYSSVHVCEQVFKVNKKSKDSPYSVAERKVPELMCRFLAVSLQVMRVINPAVGCHYFPPGLQLPLQPLRGLLPISLLGEQRHDGCKQFA